MSVSTCTSELVEWQSELRMNSIALAVSRLNSNVLDTLWQAGHIHMAWFTTTRFINEIETNPLLPFVKPHMHDLLGGKGSAG